MAVAGLHRAYDHDRACSQLIGTIRIQEEGRFHKGVRIVTSSNRLVVDEIMKKQIHQGGAGEKGFVSQRRGNWNARIAGK